MMYADPILRRQLLALGIDLDLIPPLLRKAQIVSEPGQPGLLPLPRATFRKNVRMGLIAGPVKIGKRAVAWRRSDIVKILVEGIQQPRRISPKRRALATATPAAQQP
jgi:hypothetical protein